MSVTARVLIVDDEPDVVVNWAHVLTRDGDTGVTATDGEHALAPVESERPDIVLLDLERPGIDGMQGSGPNYRRSCRRRGHRGHGRRGRRVGGGGHATGALDYLLKPLPSNDMLRLAVQHALDRRRLIQENWRLREPGVPG